MLVAINCGGSNGSPKIENRILLSDVTEVAFGGWVPSGIPYATRFSIGAGAAIADLDGDGDLDVVLARSAAPVHGVSAGPSVLMRNVSAVGGPIRFEADASFGSLAVDVNANGVALGDYDADGDVDIFLACEGMDKLYRNDGTGAFVDTTEAANVAGDLQDTSSGALFADLNSDGLLDLIVTNYHHGDLDVPPSLADADRLFLNLGDGTFVDVSGEAGLEDLGATHTAAVADLDNNGSLDIYVANDAFNGSVDFPRDGLYTRQDLTDEGTPVFVDVAPRRQATALRDTMGIALRDFDNDGSLDVYLTNWGANALLTWDPNAGVYHERAEDFGLANAQLNGTLLIGWGALPLDLDHDGAIELLVVNGDVAPAGNSEFPYGQLDFYFRQPTPGAPFEDVTALVGMPTDIDPVDPTAPASGRGAFAGDLDGDGDLDIVLGAYGESFRIYENQSLSANHFVRLQLTGTTSAPDPVGAVVRILTTDGRMLTGVRSVGGEPYGQSASFVQVDLAESVPQRVDVIWPSGLEQRIDALPGFAIDREVRVREPNWLALSARIADASDPAPVLSLRLVSAGDSNLGNAEREHKVLLIRSDGIAVNVRPLGDGAYSAELIHPGVARRTVLTVSIDDRVAPVIPMISYR